MKNTNRESSIHQQETAQMFLEELTKPRRITANIKKSKSITPKVGKNVLKYFKVTNDFTCQFYIKTLTDTEFKKYNVLSESDSFYDIVKQIEKVARKFIFPKQKLTSYGYPKNLKSIKLNECPLIKCDLTIFGEVMNDIILFEHNFVNFDNIKLIINKGQIIDTIMFRLMKNKIEVWRLQTNRMNLTE